MWSLFTSVDIHNMQTNSYHDNLIHPTRILRIILREEKGHHSDVVWLTSCAIISRQPKELFENSGDDRKGTDCDTSSELLLIGEHSTHRSVWHPVCFFDFSLHPFTSRSLLLTLRN